MMRSSSARVHRCSPRGCEALRGRAGRGHPGCGWPGRSSGGVEVPRLAGCEQEGQLICGEKARGHHRAWRRSAAVEWRRRAHRERGVAPAPPIRATAQKEQGKSPSWKKPRPQEKLRAKDEPVWQVNRRRAAGTAGSQRGGRSTKIRKLRGADARLSGGDGFHLESGDGDLKDSR